MRNWVLSLVLLFEALFSGSGYCFTNSVGPVEKGISHFARELFGFTPTILLKGARFGKNGFAFVWGDIKKADDEDILYDRPYEQKVNIGYFLTALSVKDDNLWVNLDIYSTEDDITSPLIAKTDLAKAMVFSDVELKLAANEAIASILQEENAQEELVSILGEGAGDELSFSPRFWIVPGPVEINIGADWAEIIEARLNVMVEIKTRDKKLKDIRIEQLQNFYQKKVIPKLEGLVNNDERFLYLKQAYYAVVLAKWFKKWIQEHKGYCEMFVPYIDSNLSAGLTSLQPWSRRELFDRYVREYKHKPLFLSGLDVEFVSGGLNWEQDPDFKVNRQEGGFIDPKLLYVWGVLLSGVGIGAGTIFLHINDKMLAYSLYGLGLIIASFAYHIYQSWNSAGSTLVYNLKGRHRKNRVSFPKRVAITYAIAGVGLAAGMLGGAYISHINSSDEIGVAAMNLLRKNQLALDFLRESYLNIFGTPYHAHPSFYYEAAYRLVMPLKKVRDNKEIIRQAAAYFDIDPNLLASILCIEQFDLRPLEGYTDKLGLLGIAKTSIGWGQVRIDTFRMLAQKGYLPEEFAKLSDLQAGRMLENDKINLFATAAYLRYLIDLGISKNIEGLDNMKTAESFRALSLDEQMKLAKVIGYNYTSSPYSNYFLKNGFHRLPVSYKEYGAVMRRDDGTTTNLAATVYGEAVKWGFRMYYKSPHFKSLIDKESVDNEVRQILFNESARYGVFPNSIIKIAPKIMAIGGFLAAYNNRWGESQRNKAGRKSGFIGHLNASVANLRGQVELKLEKIPAIGKAIANWLKVPNEENQQFLITDLQSLDTFNISNVKREVAAISEVKGWDEDERLIALAFVLYSNSVIGYVENNKYAPEKFNAFYAYVANKMASRDIDIEKILNDTQKIIDRQKPQSDNTAEEGKDLGGISFDDLFIMSLS